jgi:pyrroline-5-carboxylate reductase
MRENGIIEGITIGCLGAGNMGSAIVSGMVKSIPSGSIYCFDENAQKSRHLADRCGVVAVSSAIELCRACGIVILAVKPDVVHSLLDSVRDSIESRLIVSIAAGVSISSLQEHFQVAQRMIRVMPNTPALIGEGMSVICAGESAGDEDAARVEYLFGLIGRTMRLPEKLMDAATALSGCGPAYVYTVLQAMADGGVKMGIPRDRALMLAAQTVLGSARMVMESGGDPISLRGAVTSPGGSTIDAVHVLERAGFSGIIIDAIEQAALKSAKLGGKGK